MSGYCNAIPKKKLKLAVTDQIGPMQISDGQLKRQEQQNKDVFFCLFCQSKFFKGCVARKYWVATKVVKGNNE